MCLEQIKFKTIKMKLKKIKQIIKAEKVNMGRILLDQALPVKNLSNVDPFLLIHHWREEHEGGQQQNKQGVGPHPHRGFSPVTFIFEGGVYHQDSIGNKSLIEKGGTQWINSGKGIIHSERPSKQLSEEGGVFEIIQFWVNTPANHKMDSPKYQPLTAEETPIVISDDGLVKTAVIAGEFGNNQGKIQTESELLILRFDIRKGGNIDISIPENYNTLIYQLDGKLNVNKQHTTGDKDLSLFETNGDAINLQGIEDTRAILLAGMPLNEHVFSHGPFVMNSKEEIKAAIYDYNRGEMGTLTEEF